MLKRKKSLEMGRRKKASPSFQDKNVKAKCIFSRIVIQKKVSRKHWNAGTQQQQLRYAVHVKKHLHLYYFLMQSNWKSILGTIYMYAWKENLWRWNVGKKQAHLSKIKM
ncbi:MAG: hypothetical protein IKP51_09670 [Treponema sp.]|nr:hypothetical protein [Treponema sp.]